MGGGVRPHLVTHKKHTGNNTNKETKTLLSLLKVEKTFRKIATNLIFAFIDGCVRKLVQVFALFILKLSGILNIEILGFKTEFK